MGKLGLADYLKLGTKAYVGLIVKRGLAEHSVKYSLGQYYSIEYLFKVSDRVSIIEDTDLYTGSQVVGHVKKGEVYLIARMQSGWINLKTVEGTPVPGWLKPTALMPAAGEEE